MTSLYPWRPSRAPYPLPTPSSDRPPTARPFLTRPPHQPPRSPHPPRSDSASERPGGMTPANPATPDLEVLETRAALARWIEVERAAGCPNRYDTEPFHPILLQYCDWLVEYDMAYMDPLRSSSMGRLVGLAQAYPQASVEARHRTLDAFTTHVQSLDHPSPMAPRGTEDPFTSTSSTSSTTSTWTTPTSSTSTSPTSTTTASARPPSSRATAERDLDMASSVTITYGGWSSTTAPATNPPHPHPQTTPHATAHPHPHAQPPPPKPNEAELAERFGRSLQLIFLDTETTGQSRQHDRIVELAAQVVTYDIERQRWVKKAEPGVMGVTEDRARADPHPHPHPGDPTSHDLHSPTTSSSTNTSTSSSSTLPSPSTFTPYPSGVDSSTATTPATFVTLINPGVPIQPGATAVHGLSDRDVANAPTTSQALDAFWEFVASHVRPGEIPVFVAHNGLGFDFPLLYYEMERHGVRLPPRLSPAYPDTPFGDHPLSAPNDDLVHVTTSPPPPFRSGTPPYFVLDTLRCFRDPVVKAALEDIHGHALVSRALDDLPAFLGLTEYTVQTHRALEDVERLVACFVDPVLNDPRLRLKVVRADATKSRASFIEEMWARGFMSRPSRDKHTFFPFARPPAGNGGGDDVASWGAEGRGLEVGIVAEKAQSAVSRLEARAKEAKVAREAQEAQPGTRESDEISESGLERTNTMELAAESEAGAEVRGPKGGKETGMRGDQAWWSQGDQGGPLARAMAQADNVRRRQRSGSRRSGSTSASSATNTSTEIPETWSWVLVGGKETGASKGDDDDDDDDDDDEGEALAVVARGGHGGAAESTVLDASDENGNEVGGSDGVENNEVDVVDGWLARALCHEWGRRGLPVAGLTGPDPSPRTSSSRSAATNPVHTYHDDQIMGVNPEKKGDDDNDDRGTSISWTTSSSSSSSSSLPPRPRNVEAAMRYPLAHIPDLSPDLRARAAASGLVEVGDILRHAPREHQFVRTEPVVGAPCRVQGHVVGHALQR